MTEPSSKTKFALTAITVLAFSLALIFLVIRPVVGRIQAVHREIGEINSQLTLLDKETENQKKAIAEIAQIEESMDEIKTLFPERDDMVVLVQGLENAAQAAGIQLELDIIDDQNEADERKREERKPLTSGLSGVREVPYTIEFSSDYESLIDYLWYFESLPFVSKIGELKVTAVQLQSDQNQPLRNTGIADSKIEGVLFIKNQ